MCTVPYFDITVVLLIVLHFIITMIFYYYYFYCYFHFRFFLYKQSRHLFDFTHFNYLLVIPSPISLIYSLPFPSLCCMNAMYDMYVTYVTWSDLLSERNIEAGSDLTVMVVNEGEIDLYLNFACSCHVHDISMNNVIVFAGSRWSTC